MQFSGKITVLFVSNVSLLFHLFNQSTTDIALPHAFTFPFYYQPHALALQAAAQLQQQLDNNFEQKGRMYGVLVVKNHQGELGYLAGCSGTETTNSNKHSLNDYFVPSVFAGFDPDSFYLTKQKEVNQITADIAQREADKQYGYLAVLCDSENAAANFQITRLQSELVERKKLRKIKRAAIADDLVEQVEQQQPEVFQQAKHTSIQLSRESVQDKKQLAELKQYWKNRIALATDAFDQLNEPLLALRKSRRQLSNRLQKLHFQQYQFLNINGQTKGLGEIFAEEVLGKPPAGAGDCAAPKLLQYAFEHNYTPICMAEFWWGASPKSEIRKHQHYYPACQGKCQPILGHMLQGMKVDENPLLITPKPLGDLKIMFQDDDIVVVNKPAELLSVPGKHIKDSVYTRIKAMFPNANGNLIVHRLDMATSGLLMLALSHRAQKKLQQQFINKTIDKRYIAVVEGIVEQDSGTIELPLITDILDRPRQKVCFQTGKKAKTQWQVLSRYNGLTKVALNPVTGRTHQLRVHCAHPEGLNLPIVGDSLYGTVSNRLHLQAKYLQFDHPISGERLTFELADDF